MVHHHPASSYGHVSKDGNWTLWIPTTGLVSNYFYHQFLSLSAVYKKDIYIYSIAPCLNIGNQWIVKFHRVPFTKINRLSLPIFTPCYTVWHINQQPKWPFSFEQKTRRSLGEIPNILQTPGPNLLGIPCLKGIWDKPQVETTSWSHSSVRNHHDKPQQRWAPNNH